MSAIRIYQATPLTLNEEVSLSTQASHHLAHVLRVRVDEAVTLFNGHGGEYLSVIKEINKKEVVVAVKQFIPREIESPVSIYLAQGIARGEKMDFIVQKAVELGVNHIFPLITERCNVRLDKEREAKRLMHWESVVISACEQSGRNRIPTIHSPQTLETWLQSLTVKTRLVLSPYAIEPMKLQPCSDCALLIGPEGGLTRDEIQLTNQYAFKAVTLGPRVLRTETATLAAITTIQSLIGDFC